jgi:hypothetical protein
VICIFGIGGTLVILCIGVLAFLFYFRIKPVIDSVKKTTRTVENVTSSVEDEIVRPIAQVAAVAQGIRQVAGMFCRQQKKHGGE